MFVIFVFKTTQVNSDKCRINVLWYSFVSKSL